LKAANKGGYAHGGCRHGFEKQENLSTVRTFKAMAALMNLWQQVKYTRHEMLAT
jgi:hypothetical protein